MVCVTFSQSGGIYKATPSQSLVSGHTSCLKYMQADRVVRTMWLWLIELRQEEEVLKPYHRCMFSKPQSANNSLSDHIITHSSCYELFKCTGSSTIKFNDELMSHSAVSKFSIRSPCAAGNELEIEIEILRAIMWLNTSFYVIFYYKCHYSPQKLAYQNDQKLIIDLEWPNT